MNAESLLPLERRPNAVFGSQRRWPVAGRPGIWRLRLANKAANWILVGQTQGRGKLEKQRHQVCSFKQIWLYPIHPHFRKILCA